MFFSHSQCPAQEDGCLLPISSHPHTSLLLITQKWFSEIGTRASRAHVHPPLRCQSKTFIFKWVDQKLWSPLVYIPSESLLLHKTFRLKVGRKTFLSMALPRITYVPVLLSFFTPLAFLKLHSNGRKAYVLESLPMLQSARINCFILLNMRKSFLSVSVNTQSLPTRKINNSQWP